jgi:hypothetical protein
LIICLYIKTFHNCFLITDINLIFFIKINADISIYPNKNYERKKITFDRRYSL